MQTTTLGFDPFVGATLKSLLESQGLPLLSNPAGLKELVRSRHPHALREVTIVAQALEAGTPQALLRPAGGESPVARSLRVAQQLSHDTAMAPDAAQWAVHTWQQGLGMSAATDAGGVGGASDTAEAAMAAPLATLRPAALMQQAPLDVGARVLSTVPPRRNPKLLAAGAAAVLVVAGAGLWFGLLQSNLQVTGVRTAQPVLVGDGKPQPVLLSFASRSAEAKAVDVRWLRGDGNWNPPLWTVNLDTGGRSSGELAAGTLAYRATAPMNATFEYTLVSRDGKRSAPFEHTFRIVPPVVITSARLASPPRLGQPNTVQLGYRKGAGEIVQVTRRVVDSTVPWPQPEQTLPVNLNQATGSYDVALDATTQPMSSTLEFEMVDSLGVKSDPVRVAVSVGMAPMSSGPATVVSVNQVTVKGEGTGAGAVVGGVAGAGLGSTIGRGNGRTAATVLGAVGGAFAGHEVEKRVRSSTVWETAVRFDDGNTRRIRHGAAPRWAAGERVMVAGDTISR
jgi:outer membrane lipoprotein SlyB